jgi:hypothetical protein
VVAAGLVLAGPPARADEPAPVALAPSGVADPAVLPFAALREVPPGTDLPKKAQVVTATEGGRPVRRWVFPVLGTWYSGPASVHRATVGGVVLEVLDLDGDGALDGGADQVRWAGGAFQAHPPSRRLASARGIVAYRLERRGDAWVVHATPEARPADASPAEWAGLLAACDLRNRAGLAPLALDRARCAGCAKHAEYIRLNPKDGFGHHEVEGRPGYSRDGLEAAQRGVMERTANPAVAVERLTRMMLHRPPFLGRADEPLGVGTTAIPTSRAAAKGPLGTGFTVLWGATPMTSTEFPVVVPAPGASGVPREALAEVPEPERHAGFYTVPRGYPVSVGFLAGGRVATDVKLFVVTRKEARPVEGYLFTPDRPVHSSFAHNYATAFFLPKSSLESEATYAVEATFASGEPSVLRWTFRTE